MPCPLANFFFCAKLEKQTMAGIGKHVVEKRAAGFVIFRRFVNEIQYLLLKASYERNLWTPPKGHVDPGESDFETALRETEEEAGYTESDLKIFDFQKVLKYEARGAPKTVVYWLAELLNPDKPVRLSDEHDTYEWSNLEKSCELSSYADTQELLRDCDRYIKQEVCSKS